MSGNRLQAESSPYLLQHAHNPVHWLPWGDEALARAVELDRPIFLSVGYAACHWCHVMERESFEDDATAALLNAHFVPVKVDREERPDVDAFTIDALLAMTGEAGWPASLWLTPDLKPIYAGTYFPPHPRYGLPGFRDLLRRLAEEWEGSRASALSRAGRVHQELLNSQAGPVPEDAAATGLATLLRDYDRRSGGWGQGAKFPQCPRIELLLAGDDKARQTAWHLLDILDRSGVHDHVGGGFHRYAVDSDWEVPHFEKMLYDNAQLARVNLRAWLVGGPQRLMTVGCDTLEYMLDTLRAPSGAFYSSQDADDPDGEGSCYAWTPDSAAEALGPRAPAFCAAYGVTRSGNFERGLSVLNRKEDPAILSVVRAKLREVRAARPQPATDTKEVLAWNGLAISALATGAVLGEKRYLNAATQVAELLLSHGAETLPRTLARNSPPAVLDDYALLAEGLLDLHAVSGEARWLLACSDLAVAMISRFGLPFRQMPPGSSLPSRPAAFEEGAEPSGPGIAALVLARLSALDDHNLPVGCVDAALGGAGLLLSRQPEAAPSALRALMLHNRPPRTVVLAGDPGPERDALRRTALSRWRPDTLVITTNPELEPRFGALSGKRPGGRARAYVCEGTACLAPVSEPESLDRLLSES